MTNYFNFEALGNEMKKTIIKVFRDVYFSSGIQGNNSLQDDMIIFNHISSNHLPQIIAYLPNSISETISKNLYQ